MRDYSRLEAFLDKCQAQIYEEHPTQNHIGIIKKQVERFFAEGLFKPGMKVLDVGCGQAPALPEFERHGAVWYGVTRGKDFAVCKARNLHVRDMDQSFLDTTGVLFDIVWARHVLEHSIFPFFTLSEYNRVLVPNGLLYVEVPQAETIWHHEDNQNHYCIMPPVMWLSLFRRSGFEPVWKLSGPPAIIDGGDGDPFWWFILRKVR